jgi:hypothetical protein
VIYVDALFTQESRDTRAHFVGTRTGHRWCHCWSGTPGPAGIEELRRFGIRLGLKPSWFQQRSSLPHWDLVPSKRALALKLGARELSLRTWLTWQHLL